MSGDAGKATAARQSPSSGTRGGHFFAPRKSVQDDRLFGGVYGGVRAEAMDETGTPTSATVRITVTR